MLQSNEEHGKDKKDYGKLARTYITTSWSI